MKASARITAFVDALPTHPGMRVLEIGCGPGVAARLVSGRVAFVLALDRSARAIETAIHGSQAEIASGQLSFRQIAAEDFALDAGEAPFDLAFAMRVGAFDGRHPDAGARAIARLRDALMPTARLYIDAEPGVTEIPLK